MKIKKGDKVKIIAGKDKNKEGIILKVFPKENRIKVEGVNIVTKHIKPSQQDQEGGIVKTEGKIHASNALYLDPKVKKNVSKASRIGYKFEKNNEKYRFSKKTGNKV